MLRDSQVCNTKNASDPGHALEIITNRGVLSLVPELASTCAEWEAMLHMLGPLEVSAIACSLRS